jgi:hypothetical protein
MQAIFLPATIIITLLSGDGTYCVTQSAASRNHPKQVSFLASRASFYSVRKSLSVVVTLADRYYIFREQQLD